MRKLFKKVVLYTLVKMFRITMLFHPIKKWKPVKLIRNQILSQKIDNKMVNVSFVIGIVTNYSVTSFDTAYVLMTTDYPTSKFHKKQASIYKQMVEIKA